MSWLSSLIHPGRAYKKAAEEQEKYYGQAQDYLNPYNERGLEAGNAVSGAMNNLLNPDQLYNDWAQGYQMSPYAQQQQQAATQNGLNAASSMGLMGSTPALQAIQAGTSQIGNQDRQNYLNQLMNMYFQGAGIGQNIYGQGAQAGGQLGQNAMNQGTNAAEMAYGRQAAGGNMLGGLLGAGAGMLTGYNPWTQQNMTPWSPNKSFGGNVSGGMGQGAGGAASQMLMGML